MGHHHNKARWGNSWKEEGGHKNLFKNLKDSFYRCGSKGHWSRTCCTPKHLVELYKASLKGKEKEKEINFTKHHDPKDHTTHLDTSKFIEDFVGKDDDN